MENKRKTVMKFIKDNLDRIALVLLISVIVLAVRHWLQWDVKDIDAEFVDSEEVHAFTYEGKIYYELEQEMRKSWDDDYERIPKELYSYYNGYLIDDLEVLEYFNAYAET